MQVKPERLDQHLTAGLAACYLVFGPEPLQALESADSIRAAARSAGVSERIIFDAAGTPDWNGLQASAGNLSLFAERRLIEIRLGTKKPDKAGAECIAELIGIPSPADVYLITADALDRQQQAAPWFKTCDRIGVVVPCRELDMAMFKRWLMQRAQLRGLSLSVDANDFIALRAEGNMLAAAQEIDKLALIAPDTAVDLNAAMVAVADSARYDVFQCIDAAIDGDPTRAVRMVRGLREEGTEPIVIGWSLNRELRTLTRIAAARATGMALEGALTAHNVWSSRQGLVKRALQRHSITRLAAFLEASIRLDQLIKGSGIGNVWDEIETLILGIAGGPWLGRPEISP